LADKESILLVSGFAVRRFDVPVLKEFVKLEKGAGNEVFIAYRRLFGAVTITHQFSANPREESKGVMLDFLRPRRLDQG